nr:hypothetical protein [bacterium]
MRVLVPLLLILLAAAAPVRAGDDFVIRRLRLVENPRPALLPGEEVLEMNFGVLTPGMHAGFGLALRFYSSDGTYLGGEDRAYF